MFSKLFKKREPAPIGSRESNDEIRSVLKSMGDDGSAVRHVIHYAYPQKGNDLATRPAMAEELSSKGFKVEDAAQDAGFVMEQNRSVNGDDFDAFTLSLAEWFSAKGWDYDGWECAVVKAG